MKLENVKVIEKLPLQEGASKTNGNPWKNQVYIVETQEAYPRKIAVECFGAKADEIQLAVGQVVSLEADVESREYNGRWYTSVRAWKLGTDQAAAPAPATAPAPVPDPIQAAQPAPAPIEAERDKKTGFPF